VSVGFAYFKRLLCSYLAVAFSLLTLNCQAAEEKLGFGWQVGSQWQEYDNLFLAPENLERSESVLGSFAGINYRKRYSLQTFTLKAKVTDFRYSTFDYLNYLGKDFDAAWLWAFTPDLTGTLSSSRQQGINSFVDYDGGVRNLRKERKDALDVRWRITGGWHLAGGGAQTAVRNTLGGERFVEGDYKASSYEFGAMYAFASQSQITLVQINQTGEYRSRAISEINQVDSGFEQASQELRLDWRLSGKSKLNLKLGHTQREHDHFSLRDYEGTYGSADYLWNNGGKFNFKLNARQDYTSFQSSPQRDLLDALAGVDYYNSSYYRSQLVSFAPSWQLLNKISLSGKLQREERDYIGGILTVAELQKRQDTLQLASVSLDWMPRDVVAISLHMSRQDRSSNLPSADFIANSVGISAALSF
jgi:exopolysaccharide biosynthesis operon protein EpsL